MRIATSFAAILFGAASPGLADDLLIRADIAEATVFLSGAEVTRRAEISIPDGAHRLLVAMPDAAEAEMIEVSGPDGLILGPPQRIAGYSIAEGRLDTEGDAAARAAVEAAESALIAAQDRLAVADTRVRALDAQIAYLTALTRGGPDGAGMPEDPEMVTRILGTLGTEFTRVQDEMHQAQIGRRALVDDVTDRQVDLAAATAALNRLQPMGTMVDVLEIPVRASGTTEGEISIRYLSPSAGWEPSYELRLDSETGAIEFGRFVTVYAAGGGRWQDVEMSFSTAEPARQRGPSELSPDPVRIVEPLLRQPEAAEDRAGSQVLTESLSPVMEPAVVMEDRAVLQVDGLSVTYLYGDPVTVGQSGEAVLPLDSLDLEGELEARATPRYDETAFLVARVENDTGEPILSGSARFYRDGALVGEDWLPLIPPGADADLAFGPLDHLRLVWIDRSLAEGDRGVFVSANTQEREIAFGVENTSDMPETVRLLYATPFSEQEDLRLDLTLSDQPDETDVDDRRGVQAWTLDVAPGATEMVEMRVELDWPEGRILTWQP